jgi:hypothetical protein
VNIVIAGGMGQIGHLNASTATVYRHTLDRPMDELTSELGGHEPIVGSAGSAAQFVSWIHDKDLIARKRSTP